jgi:uncharacterized protein CbrC (UPF0167 family)
LTEDDKQKCEGVFSIEECLKALKKTPGLDGFTSEFYLKKWNDVYMYLVRSLNTAGEVGRSSISQRQDVITCKSFKALFYREDTFTFLFIIFCQEVKKGFVLSKNSPCLGSIFIS